MRILKINDLPSKKNLTWVDRDVIMLYACFQILEDSIEKEHVDTHVNYEAHKDFVDEVRFLYNWWKLRKEKRMTDELMIEDDEMLIRLMKIRVCLWT